MTVAVIILSLILAYGLTMAAAAGKFDQVAAIAWEDAKAVPASAAAVLKALGLAALGVLVLLAMAVLAVTFGGAWLVLAFFRWLWSKHTGRRIRQKARRRNRYAGRHLACTETAP